MEEKIRSLLKKFHKTAPFDDFPGWRWGSPRKISSKCSNCGLDQEVYCLYADAGAVDYYDEFYHICLSCGHIDHNSQFGGSVGYESPAFCVYCGFQWA